MIAPPMNTEPRLTVLQAKFAAYLSWSQPFLHTLIDRLGEHVENVVLCNRTENLERFPVKHVERLPTRYLVQPRLGVLAASYLRKTWHPDVIHGHFGWSGLRLLLMQRLLEVPLVVSFGGRDLGMQVHLPGYDRLYAALLDACDAIICVSADLRDKALEAGADPSRVHVIHRGADLDGFAFVDRGARPAPKTVTVLMVGRIVRKKGHEDALNAIARLAAERLDVRLVVVGEGEDYHQVRRLRRRLGLGRRVELRGATDHAGVRAAMAEADLLLHCSITPPTGDVEGIPNVVVEAQATGLPVVVTRHGGIPEAMRDGETGTVVPENDVDALVAALRPLIQDRAHRLETGERARAFVREHFDVTRQVERHLAIYRDVVEKGPRARGRALPDDYLKLIDDTLLAQRIEHPTEFSIAELMERLVWARRFEEEAAGGAGALSAVASSGVFVPEASRIAPGRTVAREGGPSGGGAAEVQESTLERLYNLKGLVPQSIKFPIKMTLGRLLVAAIEWRYRRRHGAALAALERADREVFDYFQAGGDLDGWEAKTEARLAAAADQEVGETPV